MFRDKRLLLAIVSLAALAVFFWAGSRVPQLNEKAIMGESADLDAIGFDVVYAVKPDDSVVMKVLKTTVNWLQTNKKGMTFGVLFAAIIMVLFSLLKKRSFKSRFANSGLGMIIGAPLGVCVNCAAPIARGIHSGGAAVETTLAAMISSPTLNVIVLSILFSLFPLYIVTLKLALTIGFILIGIPLIVRFFGKDVQVPSSDVSCPLPFAVAGDAPPGESWFGAGKWMVTNYAKNLWFITKRTVPLMFVAGFLGAVLVTLVPWDSLVDLVPGGGVVIVLASMSVVALVGITLPVPIAFDVIVSAVLLAGGMPIRYVMVLLFTLGVYSIYSFFIVWNGVSKRISVALYVSLAGLGVVGGVIADRLHKQELQARQDLFYATFGETANPNGPTAYALEVVAATDLKLPTALVAEPMAEKAQDGIAVKRSPFGDRIGADEIPFSRMEGRAFGFDEDHSFSVLNYLTFSRFRGVASGDVHNDGWTDVLLTSEHGFTLYANDGGKRFMKQRVDIPDLRQHYVVNAALVDMNNDGWLDIVYASYRKGIKVAYNDGGQFSGDRIKVIPNLEGAPMPGAMAFGDVDEDGDLDIVLGNWTIGVQGQGQKPSHRGTVAMSRNALVLQQDGEFVVQELDGYLGETLTTLLTDINGDGHLDLFVGNDSDPPDDFCLGDGKGNFRRLTLADKMFPSSTRATMSITSADVDNDLLPELFFANLTGRLGGGFEMINAEREIAAEIVDPVYREYAERILELHENVLKAVRTQDISLCAKVDEKFREDCIAVMLFHAGTRWQRDAKLCGLYPENWDDFSYICDVALSKRIRLTAAEREQMIDHPGDGTNALLMQTGDLRFTDNATTKGIGVTGWSWNSKFADVNNDEWQDLFVVNGEFVTGSRESNQFYENQGGQKMVDKTAEYGLRSFLAASAYTYLDMDNDGDLDIIAVPVIGPIYTYRNNLKEGNAIAFKLRDHAGNRFGIGSKVTIHYGDGGKRHQMREVQASGGFISFDAPVAHFGLASNTSVERVEVTWSTGGTTVVQGPLDAGATYVIERKAK
ncbi:MAG: uncharacterized membrane protein YraQ (UPF0718 family) [Planctomycetota bacterium]|jgi:uncharacterized membrane protein YraQ (UPF0718 family)